MLFSRTVNAEILKLKRTIALRMVFLAPLAVVALTGFMASQAPFSTLRTSNSINIWVSLTRVNLQFWGLLMMPLYITLQSALIAGVDHAENQWKALFARPIPRWTVYVAKLLMLIAMTIMSGAILISGVILAGVLLPHIAPGVDLRSPIPLGRMVQPIAEMTGLAFLPLAIQHWVSLRWRSFSVAVGFGIVATVTTFAMLMAAGQYGAWPQYYPWALPLLVVSRHQQNITAALLLSITVGLAASVAGCLDFCRREIA